jgi:hypothetical protein
MDQGVDKDSICQTCGKSELVFAGPNTTEHFCQWLFSGESKGAIVIAHNFKGHDSLPILGYLYQIGVKPRTIANSANHMYIEVPGCRIRMIDFINFSPSALSELPKMLGLEELKKGYFPHLFNRKENQSVVLNHLPDVHYYNPDAMKVKDRKVFFVSFKTNYRQRFDFQIALLSYCRSNMDILRRAYLAFRQLFLEMTSANGHGGTDSFQQCITIASACNLVLRMRLFLRPDTIGIIPAQGYRQEEKHSIKAMQWIKYLSTTEGVRIQHVRNSGEKEIGLYKVDGYYENENGQKYVLEFNGMFWHGYLHCYNASTVNPVNGMTMGDLYQLTMEKNRYLKPQGYIYVGKWECEFDREVRENDTLRNFVQQSEMINPLEPRNAFFGGRTVVFTLFQKDQDI